MKPNQLPIKKTQTDIAASQQLDEAAEGSTEVPHEKEVAVRNKKGAFGRVAKALMKKLRGIRTLRGFRKLNLKDLRQLGRPKAKEIFSLRAAPKMVKKIGGDKLKKFLKNPKKMMLAMAKGGLKSIVVFLGFEVISHLISKQIQKQEQKEDKAQEDEEWNKMLDAFEEGEAHGNGTSLDTNISQAASVGATGDSRVKRSEDSPPDETREIRLEDVRGKKSHCHGICGWAFPNRGQEREAFVCGLWCAKGNVEWSQPSEGVKICLLSCKMTLAGCNDLCEKRCNDECDRRFPHNDTGAGINLRLCKGSCKTEIHRTPVRRFVGGKGV